LKIIPLKSFSEHDPPSLSLDGALKHVRASIQSEGTSALLFTDKKMNRAIEDKIGDIPQNLSKHRHIAQVIIPRLLAQVIHRNKQIIAPAIHAFYDRMTQFKVYHRIPFHINSRNYVSSNIFRQTQTGSRPTFTFLVLFLQL
jgi:SGT1 protein